MLLPTPYAVVDVSISGRVGIFACGGLFAPWRMELLRINSRGRGHRIGKETGGMGIPVSDCGVID